MRGYYGDLRHNVKAVYQFYMGAYDGNPANLNPCLPRSRRNATSNCSAEPTRPRLPHRLL